VTPPEKKKNLQMSHLRIVAREVGIRRLLQEQPFSGSSQGATTASGHAALMRQANGNKTSRRVMILPEIGPIDGRTRPAIMYREVACAVAEDLGGKDQLSRAQLELVKRAAGLAVLADQVEHRLVNGEAVDATEYATVVGTQSRVLRTLGLKRAARDVTTLEAYAAKRDATT
jgi:hypothetical protein